MSELAFAPAGEIGGRVARREISARQVTEAFLARIESLGPRLNCFTQILSDVALDQARRIDDGIRAGRPVGPLAGVPVAIKDIVDVAGTTTTAGAHPVFHRHASSDATLVARLRAAGAILIGKTGLHEFAYGVTSTNPHHGPVRNPWDLTRIPGGSSGGSAAAVAAGLCAGAVGTDTGGSIRIPAALCGITGVKPTFGAVPLDGVIPLAWTLDHAGPLARSVRDAALLLDVMTGTVGRPGSVSQHLEGVAEAVGVRVGLPRAGFWASLDPEVEHLCASAVTVLRDLGADIRDVDVPYAGYAGRAAAVILSAEATAYHERHLRAHPQDYGEDVQTRLLRGFFLRATDYVAARRAQAFLRDAFLRAFEQTDVLIMPTTPAPASPIDEEPASRAGTSLAMSVQLTRFTNPFNLTGLPALSVPCGFTRAGLPVGLQIAGRPGEEGTVLRVAAAYERAAAWQRRPPL